MIPAQLKDHPILKAMLAQPGVTEIAGSDALRATRLSFAKTYMTAVGPKEATMDIQIHDRGGLAIRHWATYESEGRNVLSTAGMALGPIGLDQTAEEALSWAHRFMTDVDASVHQSYAARLYRSRGAPDADDEPSQEEQGMRG